MYVLIAAVVIVLIIVIFFRSTILQWLSPKQTFISYENNEAADDFLTYNFGYPQTTATSIEEDLVDNLYSKNDEPVKLDKNIDSDLDLHWGDYIKGTSLDPAVESNHQKYIKDISLFYTGAGFTQVADDNRDAFSMNFIGLRRPKHVPIGEDARQQQDVDQEVLKRNTRHLV